MISLCALLETSHRFFNLDYNHLFSVIEAISADKAEDLYEAFRRMSFNVLFGNKDDHGKNFAFLYDEKKRGYVLAPAYDITPTPSVLEHSMTVNGQGNPTKKDLLEVGKRHGLSAKKCSKIMEAIESVISEHV